VNSPTDSMPEKATAKGARVIKAPRLSSSNRVQERRSLREKGLAVEEASAGVCQEILLRSMALRITSSLRMQAVRADLGYFPCACNWA
jgi:hypothetical protein